MNLHIGIVGPIASADIQHLLDAPSEPRPRGYEGAPLLVTLIEELLRRGHRVSAFTLSSDMPLHHDAACVAHGQHGRLTLHHVPMRPRAWPFNGRRLGRIVDLYAFERAGLQNAIAQASPDVLHAHWSYEFAWAALRSGLPTVVTCHDAREQIARHQQRWRHRAYRWLRAAMAWHVLKNAGITTAVSPYIVEEVQRWCPEPVSVIPNPLPPLPPTQPVRAPAGLSRIVIASNGWCGLKNTEPAMRAFSHWANDRQDVSLHLYGQGFEHNGPAHLWWQSQGLTGNAIFHGPVSRCQLLSAMTESDVLLHGSLQESFGMVLAEAMVCGLVVIAGKNSGAVPWVVGDAGLLVNVNCHHDMASTLSTLDQNPQLLQTLRARAIAQTTQRFGITQVADAYVHQYQSALAISGRSIRGKAA